MNTEEKFAIGGIVVLSVVIFTALALQYSECTRQGGDMVRTLFWFVCK